MEEGGSDRLGVVGGTRDDLGYRQRVFYELVSGLLSELATVRLLRQSLGGLDHLLDWDSLLIAMRWGLAHWMGTLANTPWFRAWNAPEIDSRVKPPDAIRLRP